MMAEEWGGLVATSRDQLLGHLRPAAAYAVETVGSERRGALVLTHYLISGAAYAGAEVRLSLRLCTVDGAAPAVVFSVPGGGGQFPDDALWWLAGRFQVNQAAVDWVGRGQSPSHDAVVCRYDPIFMATDDFRESFLFHNLAAIWTALDWLFSVGYRPVDVVGGSWGGVLSLLLAALDRRVERAFSSFGCGGFALPGIEKRSMWDAAFEEMGPARTANWCRAFDPLLRMPDIDAGIYYETATNDKFFSIDMAMATWQRVANPIFLAIMPNRDHDMKPLGAQPYVVQSLGPAVIARCRAVTDLPLEWDMWRGEAAVAAPPDGLPAALRLFASEQHPAHGNMSREWREVMPAEDGAKGPRFPLYRTHSAAELRYFAQGLLTAADGTALHAATPIRVAAWPSDDRPVAAAPPYRLVVDAAGVDPIPAAIGDKCHPAIRGVQDGWRIEFSGTARARATRFGLRPWLLPRDWRVIEVALAAPPEAVERCLHLALSRRYQRLDEEAVLHPFRTAARCADGNLRRYSFGRAGFEPGVIVEERFRRHAPPLKEAVLDDFDAVGLIDFDGGLTEPVVLVSIAIR